MRTLHKRLIVNLFVIIAILLLPRIGLGDEELPPAQATLELEWEIVEDAIAYEVKLTPKKDGARPITLSAPENKINARVPVGEYKLQIRSQDKQSKYWGRWSQPSEIEVATKRVQLVAPENESIIKPKDAKRAEVQFEWNSIPNAKKYTMRLWTDDGGDPVEFKTKEITKSLQLLPGRVYYWHVTFETERSIRYQADPLTYSFTLLGHPLDKPIIDPEMSTDENVQLSWSEPAGVESFRIKFSRHALDETVWQPLKEIDSTDKTNMKFQIPQAGVFRIEVIASAKNRMDSPLAFREFLIKPSERKLMAALQPLLEAANPIPKDAKETTKELDPDDSSEKDSKKEPTKEKPKKVETKTASKNRESDINKAPAAVAEGDKTDSSSVDEDEDDISDDGEDDESDLVE